MPAETRPGRILVVTPQPFYEDRGSPIALQHVLEAMSALGHEVDVIAFPMGRSLPIPGVTYHRTLNPLGFRSVPIGFSVKKLFLDALLGLSLALRLRRHDYLCVHAVEEAVFPAVLFCGRRGPPVTYDMQSRLSQQLGSHPLLGRSLPRRLLEALERWALRRVGRVTCSSGLLEDVQRIAPGLPVHAWRFPAELVKAPDSEATALRKALGIAVARPVVLYAGSFAGYQGLAMLVRAIPRIVEARGDVAFVLVGGASDGEIASVREMLDPRFSEHVHLLRRVSREEIPRFLAMADVLVSTRAESSNLPLKIFDYLASGRPIVATDDVAHRALLTPECAALADASPQGLAGAVVSLLEDPEHAARLGTAALRFSEVELGTRAFHESVREILEHAREASPAYST